MFCQWIPQIFEKVLICYNLCLEINSANSSIKAPVVIRAPSNKGSESLSLEYALSKNSQSSSCINDRSSSSSTKMVSSDVSLFKVQDFRMIFTIKLHKIIFTENIESYITVGSKSLSDCCPLTSIELCI